MLVALSLVLLFALLLAFCALSNMALFQQTLLELHADLINGIHAVFVGVGILFGVTIVLGSTAILIKLNNARKIQVIGYTKHGPTQAVVHKGELVQLSPVTNVTASDRVREMQDVMRFAITMANATKKLAPAEVESSVQNLQLPAPGAPSQDRLMEELEPNSLTVSPGVRASNGAIVKVNITEIPHLKVIGSSGFGKSCLAAAILDQAMTLNDPDVLQVALLDLEHKTSRLFEHREGIAELTVGRRRVSMVATDVDEVVEHLGYLKKELDRRTRLGEDELAAEPVLLMYVEEMLALQYEVDDKKALDRMLADLSILAVRGRKYGMFLLCCTQTDYSTDELRVARKQFRFRAAAGVDMTAAKAAGFMNTELIKQNFQAGQPGQFVVEFPSFSDLVLAPRYDWKKQLQVQGSVSRPVQQVFTGPLTPPALPVVNSARTGSEQALNNSPEQGVQAKRAQVQALLEKEWGKIRIIEKVWNVSRGGSAAWKQACAEYEAILVDLEEEW